MFIINREARLHLETITGACDCRLKRSLLRERGCPSEKRIWFRTRASFAIVARDNVIACRLQMVSQ